MTDFSTILLAEHEQLADSVFKLSLLIWGDGFSNLKNVDKELLIKQLAFMEGYERILRERIEHHASR